MLVKKALRQDLFDNQFRPSARIIHTEQLMIMDEVV